MGVPNSQLTTNFVAKYRLITGFFWPIISKLLTPLVPSYMCFGYNGHQRSTICSTISFHDISWYTPVFCETISFWGNFYGEGGFSPAEALFVLGGSAEKNKQPNCGSRLFCSPKASQLSKVSQQFCRRLLTLQNKWYQKNVQNSFDDGSTRYQV